MLLNQQSVQEWNYTAPTATQGKSPQSKERDSTCQSNGPEPMTHRNSQLAGLGIGQGSVTKTQHEALQYVTPP